MSGFCRIIFPTAFVSCVVTVNYFNINASQLVVHLESQFYNDPKTGEVMTWDNHTTDGWHVDHIKPLHEFDLYDDEQFKEAAHYTNLQPLWAKDNLSKGGKY